MTHQPGWYPDPHAPQRLRWYDGHQWTSHSQPTPAGQPPRSRKLSTGSIVLIVLGAIVLLCAVVVIVVVAVAVVAYVANIAQGVVCGEAPHYCR